MNFIISIIRTLFRHRWLILVGTAIFTLLVFYYTRHMQGGYDVKATLYTGVASGYNLDRFPSCIPRLLRYKVLLSRRIHLACDAYSRRRVT